MQNLDIAECFIAKAKSSKQRKKSFEMSFMTFANLKKQTICSYSGKPFTEDDPFTFERIINSIGYVDGNVVAVCSSLNSIRADHNTVESVRIRQREITNKILVNERNLKSIKNNKIKSSNESKFIDVDKFVIPSSLYKNYIQLLPKYNKICKERCQAEKVLKTSTNALSTVKRTRTKIHHESIIKSSNDKITKLNNHLEHLSKEFKLEKRTFTSRRQKDNPNTTRIDHEYVLTNKIAQDKQLIQQLDVVANALDKFQNLSSFEKLAVKFGLPLDTPRVELLKHKVARKLLGDTI